MRPYHLRKNVRSALAREQSSLARGHAPYEPQKMFFSLQAGQHYIFMRFALLNVYTISQLTEYAK